METELALREWPLRQLMKLEQSQPALVHDALEKLLAQNDSLRWSDEADAQAEIDAIRSWRRDG